MDAHRTWTADRQDAGTRMQERFRQGNIHRYLCEPLGHGDLLDMSVTCETNGRAGFGAWMKDGQRFTAEHAARLEPVLPLMRKALATHRDSVRWHTVSRGTPHLIVSADGSELEAIDVEAETILKNCHLLRQNISLSGDPCMAPAFARVLLTQLKHNDVAEMDLPVVDGRLVCRAVKTRLLHTPRQNGNPILIRLELQIAEAVTQIDYLQSLTLTPLQREIALFGMAGNGRAECNNRFGVSEEALKKHIRAILNATGVERWDQLRGCFQPDAKRSPLT